MTALLDPQAADRLAKLLGMIGSQHDGEALAAARKAHQCLHQLGLTWRDVIHVSRAVGLAAYGEGLPRARVLPDAERIFIRLKHVPGPVRAVAETSAVAARYLSAGLSMSAPSRRRLPSIYSRKRPCMCARR